MVSKASTMRRNNRTSPPKFEKFLKSFLDKCIYSDPEKYFDEKTGGEISRDTPLLTEKAVEIWE
jgi:hypothetical protein